MARSLASSFLMLYFILLLLCTNPAEIFMKSVNGYCPGEKCWCVPKPSTSEALLKSNIDFSCGQGVDCGVIQQGGPCFYPDTLRNHASVVMNLYYRMAGSQDHTCDFGTSGLTTITDPSYDDCCYV